MKKVLLSLAIIATLASCSKEVSSVETVKVNSVKKTASVQCTGTTQAGNRCKNMTLSSNSRCYLHGGN
jgi:ribosomal protein L15E